MARRPKYSPAVQARICEAIRLGSTFELAAQYGGISKQTFYEWLKRKPDFADAVKEAEAQAVVRWLARIEAAAMGDPEKKIKPEWQAAAWKLERRYPRLYGRQIHEQEHTGKVVIEVIYDD